VIHFSCPFCQRQCTAPEQGVGREVPCPQCRRRVTIPLPSSARTASGRIPAPGCGFPKADTPDARSALLLERFRQSRRSRRVRHYGRLAFGAIAVALVVGAVAAWVYFLLTAR
jgi:hypothetical protein